MVNLTESGKASLDARIKEIIESKTVPGFNLGIANVDGEIYFNGGGPQNIADPDGPTVDADSVFWICSQTKLITSLAALRLIELGKISYDTVAADHIPQLRNLVIVKDGSAEATPAKTAITVKHLLNHSSGLFYPISKRQAVDGSLNDGYSLKEMYVAEDPLAYFFKTIQGDLPGVPIRFEPGTDFVYGWSSDMLGFVLEKVTGQTLEQIFKEHIFDPLGMESTFYLTPEVRKRLVNMSYRNAATGALALLVDQLAVIEQDPAKLSLHFGGVGLYTSMRDYLKLLRHLLRINAGLPVSNAILSLDTVQKIFVPTLTDAGSKSLSDMVVMSDTQHSVAMGL
ncbi:beta-lactamase/transpeptidase-like protein, partial [Agrocybe pediades]